MKRKHPGGLFVFLITLIVLLSCRINYALAGSGSSFILPEGLTEIEEEAFYGIHADQVVLPKGILRIEKNAFAYGVVKSIYLPASIQFIDDSAFEETWVKQMSADEGTYAYKWAVRNGYIKADPVSITVTSNAGDDNEGHYHDYGKSHAIVGSITSLVKIKSVRAAVVYRGGEHDGEAAFDCSQATVSSADGLYSIDIRSSNLNKYITFAQMPCGPLKMYFYADLVDGRTFTIYEYDFHIVEEKPAEISITSIAGGDQSPHKHEYKTAHSLEGSVESSIPIRTLTASVVYQTGEQAGQVAYDCSAAKTEFSEDTYSVDLSNTNLGKNLKFESMPWGLLKLYIHAELANGKTYKLYEYNFEIVDVCPVTVNITAVAGDDNSGHFHNYGLAHSFSGEITSTVAIQSIRSEVVYRGGEKDGQQAYDCSNAVLNFPEGTNSVSIRRTDLDMNLKFGSMPCAPLRIYLYADLMDGRTYKIYDYDFEIVRRCTSISINCSDKMLKQGDGFWISPTVTPSNATYINTFYFESSDPQIVSVDNFGHVQAHHTSGTATITAYTGDRFQHTSCTITVVDELLDQPLVKDYLAWPSFYDSPGTTIVLNVEEVEDADYYELYRCTTANGTYEYRGYSDGLGNEYFDNPFSSGMVIIDTDCEEETNYYYRIRARSNDGVYSEYSKTFKAHSTKLIWPDICDEEVIIGLKDLGISYTIVDSMDDYLKISGEVKANHALREVMATVTNRWGTVVSHVSSTPYSDTFQLSQLRIDTSAMENGFYLVTITATAENKTEVLARPGFTIARTVNQVPTTEQLQMDIISYVQNHNATIFRPETQVEDYFNNMSLWDTVIMGLSDYHGIAIKWLEDKLSGSKYDSYMVSKYEAQIINLLNEMNHDGTMEKAKLSTDETDFVKSLNDLAKSGTSVYMNQLNDLFVEFGPEHINWNELGTFLIVAEECEKLDNMFDGLKIGQEFVNWVIELFTDHKQDLQTLDTIASIYNPDGNPSFSMALDKIRLSYKTQYGSSIRMVFDYLWKELEKTAGKTITKAIFSITGGAVYTLADTTFQFLYKISGMKEAGKNRIDFVTQYTMLGTLQQAFANSITSIINDYVKGNLPTENQIHQLQVNFQSTRYALLQLYETMIELDGRNESVYVNGINQVRSMTMPGIKRLEGEYSGSGRDDGYAGSGMDGGGGSW